MSKIPNKNCDVCLQRIARTLCDECRKFLCKECSEIHLLQKLFMSHTLMDLDPPGEEPSSYNDEELASDFLENATVSETTVLYRAQVAIEGMAKVNKVNTTNEKVGDISKLKTKKVTEFSIKRNDDTYDVWVSGALAINDTVITVDYFNIKLKLYDSCGNYQSSTDLKHGTFGITNVNNDMFATCGLSYKVFLWTIKHQQRVLEDDKYDVDHEADGIHFNNTFYCVLHRYDNAITILDRQGEQVRKIVMKEAFGKNVKFGFDIHMDNETHNIYIPCDPPNDGILCMSVDGVCLWFTPLSGSLWGITEVHGTLCIADCTNHCLHLISKTGKYMGKLLEERCPQCIYFNEHNQKLFITHRGGTEKKDIISVYSVNYV